MDDAKAPSGHFTVRCPKCQTSIDVEPSANTPTEPVITSSPATALPISSVAPFEKPIIATRFNPGNEEAEALSLSDAAPGLDNIAKLLAEALRHTDGPSATGRKRPAWDHRKVLVCSSPAYRETIAEALAKNDYDVFIAENMAQGLGKMREERMDVVVLDANFDPIEQGVAFITREVRLMRPSERRRLFSVYVTAGVRTMDLHAAFLHNVNLVVNPSDIDQLADALEISIRQYNDLYKPLFRALDVAPI